MTDDLLVHYNRELLAIRRAAAEFASEHPRIAGRLRLSADAAEDPHVGRLIESFAYLTARVRQKLDDDFPELVNGLLGILYPHYQRPVPSMSIVQIDASKELQSRHRIPAHTLLDSEPVNGEACRFRTAYPVDLEPVVVEQATLSTRPFPAPSVPAAAGAASCLRLTLKPAAPDRDFSSVVPRTLRFFLRGQPTLSYPLHELLLNDTVAVAFARSASDPTPVIASADILRPVGFGIDEGLLEYPQNAHLGYRLLTEYFVFPEKFLFVDLAFPDAVRQITDTERLEVFIYFKRSVPTIERAVDREAFALGCTPIVNLFPQLAEPIRADHRTSEYRVVPDSRRQDALEVYSIERVLFAGTDGERAREALPFYSLQHADASQGRTEDRSGEVWWTTQHRPSDTGEGGTETYLSLVDPDFEPSELADDVLSVDLLCLNRDLPERLPFGGGHPTLGTVQPSPAIVGVRCLTPPTSTLRTLLGQGGRWRLISHLTLNHLSLVEEKDASAIREILTLYDFKDSAETRALIDGVVSLQARTGSARVRGNHQIAFCRGIDVEMMFDDTHFSGSSVFLLASIIERFLGLYASVNAFSRLTARIKGRSGIVKTWPARAGDRILL